MSSNEEIKCSKNWKWLDYKPDELYVPCAHKECFVMNDEQANFSFSSPNGYRFSFSQ